MGFVERRFLETGPEKSEMDSMSHLIIELGKNVGNEITIPESGMKFGRSPANDIVLDDEAVMLFHGRFFFKSDGSLWVTDFGAGEKTRVGNQPISEHQLMVGDLVAVGATAFRVINTGVGDDEISVVEVPAEEAGAVPIDLGFKRSKGHGGEIKPVKESSHGTLSHRLTLLATALLTVVVILAIYFSIQRIMRGDSADDEEKRYLLFSYERVEGKKGNIYRYHLELDAKGYLSLEIKDLQGNLSFEETKKVSPSEIDQLSARIGKTEVMALDEIKAGGERGYDLYDLVIQRDGFVKHLSVLNYNNPPLAVREVAAAFKSFARQQFENAAFIDTPSEKLLTLAEEAYEVGVTMYEARDVRTRNLPDAIIRFRATRNYLEYIEPKPDLYLKAVELLKEAVALQDERYKDYMFRADQAIRNRQWEEARKNLHYLQLLIPDRDDERFSEINLKMLKVDDRLR